MTILNLTVSLYDGSRRAEVMLPAEIAVAELMEQCTTRWSLPPMSFAFRLRGAHGMYAMLHESDTLAAAGVGDGSELQVFPIAEGG